MIYNLKKILRNSLIYDYYRYIKIQRGLKRFDNEDIKRCEFYKKFIKPKDLVFDVGANMGNRTKNFLKIGSRVIAFEPQRKCVEILESSFAAYSDFVLEKKALGKDVGRAVIFTSKADAISSMSSEWINATTESGRFEGHTWSGEETVQVVTLDLMIEKYGEPSFLKIDVEGFEFDVLSGLSHDIKYISIEFTPEYIGNTFKCIDHMIGIGDYDFQVSIGESMDLYLDEWVSHSKIKEVLLDLDPSLFGDVYFRNKTLQVSKHV